MRVLIVTLALLCALCAPERWRNKQFVKRPAPKERKKAKNTETAAKNQEKKPRAGREGHGSQSGRKSRSRPLPNRGPTKIRKNLTSPKFRRW